MFESRSKAEVINFILKRKYDIKEETDNVIAENIKKLNAPSYLLEFNSEATTNEMESIYTTLESEIEGIKEEKIKDLIFGILNSSLTFVKDYKKKDFNFQKIAKFYKDIMTENKKLLSEYYKQSSSKGKIEIGLPEKRIVTRFPPEANGYLHIGHAKAAILNDYLSLTSKDGELIFRFDDTNPEKESKEFEDAILEDLKLLSINKYRKVRTSDHFEEIYKLALFLIEEGKAYVDNTEVEKMRDQRMNRQPSEMRNTSKEDSLCIFKKMWKGEVSGYVLRAKISYDSTNTCLRDPVMYRNVGSMEKGGEKGLIKYFIYPTYDFACPIVDSLDGVTLALRSNEYRDRNEMYNWFLENLKLENRPKIHDFSRLRFENTVLSKRKIQLFVDKKYVENWSDPRLPTLRGLKRKGLSMEVLRDYIISQGASQKISVFSWDKLWTFNKRHIDKLSPRISGVPLIGHVVCKIYNRSGQLIKDEFIEADRCSTNKDLGKKVFYKSSEIFISLDDAQVLVNDVEHKEFTLLKIGNVIIDNVIYENKIIKEITLIENFEKGDFKSTKNKISWISSKGGVLVKLFEYGNLLKDDSVDESLPILERFNKDSKSSEYWIVESDIEKVKIGEYFQLERVGFYYHDTFRSFNLLPYTKQKRTIN